MENKSAYIYGKNSVIEALNSNKKIEKIYIQFGTSGEAVEKISFLAKKKNVSLGTVDKAKFRKMVQDNAIVDDSAKTQGIVALTQTIDVMTIEDFLMQDIDFDSNPFIIVLDEISDPHNLGAIARTAEAAGAVGLVITEKNSAPLSPAAIKASAGALEHISIAKTINLNYAIKLLKDNGFKVIGTDSEAKVKYFHYKFDTPTAVIIGSEGKGIRAATAKDCDELVSIPLSGKVSSLNASVSAGIIIYEIIRQREDLV